MTQIIRKMDTPFPFLMVENMYTEDELKLIWNELEFLTHADKLESPDVTATAYDEGEILKQNHGIFLDFAYRNRNLSNILKLNRKIFSKKIMDALSSLTFAYGIANIINFDTTLISYYENGGHYKPHHDMAVFTALTWFYRNPKQFEGGDFWFNKYDYKIEVQNNLTLIFPSFVTHSVDEVRMKTNEMNGFGRYCMTQFLLMNSEFDLIRE